jgi:superoxide dismutase, Fe-Mn family
MPLSLTIQKSGKTDPARGKTGTEYETKDIKNILLATAREPSRAAWFNHASMAHNNHFFFKNLAPEPVEIPQQLKTLLVASFGSIETLKQEMIITALSMFGPGFVWLVKTDTVGMPASFKVLVTYIAGSPYSGAHWRRQDLDMNTDIGSSEAGLKNGLKYLENTAYGTGKRSASAIHRLSTPPGGIDVLPVLCLNTWEHAWLPDFGIGVGGKGGKLAFAEAWWDRINWKSVCDIAGINSKTLVG